MIDFPLDLTLEDEGLFLRSLQKEDFSKLHRLCRDSELWDYFTHDLSKIENFESWAEDHYLGKRLQLIVSDKTTGEFFGSSGFGNYSKRDERVEIGWTWFGKKFHGKGINPRVKKLMLRYAFETLKLKRVEFKTDVLNIPARKALLKLGAVEDGVLRSHTLLHHGRRRDTIFYSFLPEDWSKIN